MKTKTHKRTLAAHVADIKAASTIGEQLHAIVRATRDGWTRAQITDLLNDAARTHDALKTKTKTEKSGT